MSNNNLVGLPNPVKSQPSWTQRNAPIIEEEPNESPAVTDSVGSGSTPHQLIPEKAPEQPEKKKNKRKYQELPWLKKVMGGFGAKDRNLDALPPHVLAAGSSGHQGGVILVGSGVYAIFPDYMPEMEDCFYAGIGVVHCIICALFIGLAIASVVVGCHFRYTFAGVWAAAPIAATAIFSFIVAKKELRRDVKKLVLCVVISILTSIIFCVLGYLSGSVDGVYYKWTDIENDQMFKSRTIVDIIQIISGAVEAVICIGHLASLISNLKDECTYRCCSRRKFRKFLKEQAKTQELGEERHLTKKKEMLNKLISDLEEEEAFKEKWLEQQERMYARQAKEAAEAGGSVVEKNMQLKL